MEHITPPPPPEFTKSEVGRNGRRMIKNASRSVFAFVKANPGLTRTQIQDAMEQAGYHRPTISAQLGAFISGHVFKAEGDKITTEVDAYVPLKGHAKEAKGTDMTMFNELFPPDAPSRSAATKKREGRVATAEPAPQNWTTATPLVALQGMTPEELVDALSIRQARGVLKILKGLFKE